MFKALDKRIKLILILVVLVYIGLASFIVFGTIKDRTMDMQRQLSVQYTEQQNKNAQLYMQWLEETTRLALNHPGLQEALVSERYDDTLAPALDGLRSSNMDIAGIVIYGIEGAVYSTSNISGIKSYSAIREEPEFARFLASDETSKWLIQSPYKLVSFPVDPRTMLFYIEKITDASGRMQGVLFLESPLSRLHGFYRSDDQAISGNSRTLFLTGETGELLESEGLGDERIEEIRDLANEQMPESGILMQETENGIVLLYRMYKSEDLVVILIDTDRLADQLNWLKYALLIVNGAIAALFVFLILQLSRSISEPLKQLYRKMRRTMQEP